MVRPGWLTRWLGDAGERVAVRHLKRQGFRIVARNSRSRIGEIDVIAMDGDCIVFVEVKTRSSGEAGHPTEAVTRVKQQQLTRTALAWLKRRNLLEHRARFDVIAITWGDGRRPVVEHFRNAFEPTGRGQMFS
ncbi:MAG: YraN family protein [Planctomycetota bacterium]|nr:MAG: YraN family protein [Planctomycetota bacterium]REJ95201.1 MAG: YraN family protein [Planctomycetota bacterium]REK25046.1 MAG: YraN family protein [Planctomycetota bacterium]REK28111.1 MAG: YraN family protein [Planctomycetota bacterium]